MSSITTLGVGSGLDIRSIVDSLVAAEREPTDISLDQRKEELDAKISAFGAIRSKLSEVDSTLSTLGSMSTFTKRGAVSSSDSVLTATAASTASVNNYSIEVTELAASHSLVTGGFTSQQDVIGTGTITLRYGTTDYTASPESYDGFVVNANATSHTITIDSSNNTLSSFRDYINSGTFGVRASIIDDGTDFRLILTSEATGAENSMEIVVDDTGDGDDVDSAGLSQLAFNSSATQLTQSQAAQDAQITVNGVAITRESNVLIGAIDGVTLTLKSKTSGSPITLDVTRDTSSIEEKVTAFVDAYNDFLTEANNLTAYDTETGEAALLLGDATMRNIQSLLRSNIGSSVTGVTGSIRALSDLGILAQTNGGYALEGSKLKDAVADDPDAVGRLFAPIGVPSGLGITYAGFSSLTTAGTYSVEITQLPTQGQYLAGGVLPDFGGGGSIDIDDDNDGFQVRINGIASGNIVLTQGNYTSGSTLAAEIQSQINGDSLLLASGMSVGVIYNSTDDRFELTSLEYGSSSTVAFIGIDTNTVAELGFSLSSGTAGVNVIGKINGADAVGAGRDLAANSGDADGLKLLVTSNVTGILGDVVFTRGFASAFDSLLESLIGSKGIIATQNEGFTKSISRIAEDRLQLDRRIDKYEARILAQFNTMDLLVASLTATNNFLTQAFEALSNIRRK
ncbi:MAG: flagellar filament capping protein FliD [Pseudomonadales bacterium]|nr:flagellar filament capping protein FliD [Pseudomonadales bacterium]